MSFVNDLLSTASSLYLATNDKECSEDDNNNDSNNNNNLLSYHQNRIVHFQHMALDETIAEWQEKQQEEGMISDNNNGNVVTRELSAVCIASNW